LSLGKGPEIVNVLVGPPLSGIDDRRHRACRASNRPFRLSRSVERCSTKRKSEENSWDAILRPARELGKGRNQGNPNSKPAHPARDIQAALIVIPHGQDPAKDPFPSPEAKASLAACVAVKSPVQMMGDINAQSETPPGGPAGLWLGIGAWGLTAESRS
jgi:hypothetical protein